MIFGSSHFGRPIFGFSECFSFFVFGARSTLAVDVSLMTVTEAMNWREIQILKQDLHVCVKEAQRV